MALGSMNVVPGSTAGGYYIPNVDDEGNLDWTPSDASMPEVAGANIMGPAGPAGATGPAGPAGADGADGEDGADGKDGEDGYTPVKGTDYFTEADKEELITEIFSRVVDGNEVAY